jgi:hypothetical protein
MSLLFLYNYCVARNYRQRVQLFPKAYLAMSPKKLRMKERAERHSAKMKASDPSNMPQFHDLLKKLYIRSHPDLLRSSSVEKVLIHKKYKSSNSLLYDKNLSNLSCRPSGFLRKYISLNYVYFIHIMCFYLKSGEYK